MGLEASFSKLVKSSESAYKSITKKWDKHKSRQALKELTKEEVEAIRQRNVFFDLINAKITGDSVTEMEPLKYDGNTANRAVFLVTIPITFGDFEFSETTWHLLARHVGMTLDSVSHWAVCVVDRGFGKCWCYDLMSDRLELTALGRNFFRVVEVVPEVINTWSSCYYVGETTKEHEDIQEVGKHHVSLKPRYRLLSNNCQHLVENMVKDLCNGKVISQPKLEEELSKASPKMARDLMAERLHYKMDVKGEATESETVKEDLDLMKSVQAFFSSKQSAVKVE